MRWLQFVIPLSVLAVPAASQTITTSSGVVEIIGLRDWSILELTDSLRRYRPDVTIGDAACAEVLRDSLGFPDAAVFRFRDGRVVLTVIEPADSHRVVLRPPPDQGRSPGGPWVQLRSLEDTHRFAVEYAIATFLRRRAGEEVAVDSTDAPIIHQVWAILEADAGEGDRRSAAAVLRESPDASLRRAAAHYLVRFPDHDSTWYALVQALRDRDWGVRGGANTVLRSFRTAVPRTLDWRPAAADLRHLLDGTTLVFQVEVVKLLLATAVAPDLSSVMLSRDGTRLLLAQMAANHEYVREPASAILQRLSGIDPGANPARWEDWIQEHAGDRP